MKPQTKTAAANVEKATRRTSRAGRRRNQSRAAGSFEQSSSEGRADRDRSMVVCQGGGGAERGGDQATIVHSSIALAVGSRKMLRGRAQSCLSTEY